MKRIHYLMIMVFLFSSVLAPMPAQAQMYAFESPLIGKPVPDFTLSTVKGKKINMADFTKGKDSIVFFWATWCPHCRRALDQLKQKRDEFSKKNVEIVLVDLGEDPKTVKAYVNKNQVEYDVVLDSESSLSVPYGIIGVPTFYFVNNKGIIKAVKHSLPEDYVSLFSDKK